MRRLPGADSVSTAIVETAGNRGKLGGFHGAISLKGYIRADGNHQPWKLIGNRLPFYVSSQPPKSGLFVARITPGLASERPFSYLSSTEPVRRLIQRFRRIEKLCRTTFQVQVPVAPKAAITAASGPCSFSTGCWRRRATSNSYGSLSRRRSPRTRCASSRSSSCPCSPPRPSSPSTPKESSHGDRS